jgi:hypothetical protein
MGFRGPLLKPFLAEALIAAVARWSGCFDLTIGWFVVGAEVGRQSAQFKYVSPRRAVI